MIKTVKVMGIPKPVRINEDGTEVWYDGHKLKISLAKSNGHRHGFYQCSINNKNTYTHKLVALAFVLNERPIVYKMVLHKDCNSLNNHYKNLEWGDRTKLMENLKAAGLAGANRLTDPNYRGSSKISVEEAISIAKRLDSGEYANVICKEFGVSEMSINRIRKRYCETKQVSVRYSNKTKATIMRLCLDHPSKRVACGWNRS